MFVASSSNRIEKVETLKCTLRASQNNKKGGNYMKAVIKIGGKQVLVSENDVIYVEKIDAEVGQTVKFNEVLMLDSKVGNPYVEGAFVEGKVEKQGKQKKILVFKYKQKDRANRRTHGHRQPYTKVTITKIVG